MKQAFNILLLGASYGSLLATKLALAGHNAKLICLPDEVNLINKKGTLVRMPVKGREGLYEISSKKLSGKIEAISPDRVQADEFDLAVLAMQEPQYRSADIKNVLKDLAVARIPCMSIMNMPLELRSRSSLAMRSSWLLPSRPSLQSGHTAILDEHSTQNT